MGAFKTRLARVGLTVLTLSGSGSMAGAAAAGSPFLGATPSDYVDYAVTSLPTWFRTGQMNALENTPTDNAITNAGAELGRVLFYDSRLSHNNGASCASCHTQATGFTDSAQFSEGFEGGLTGRHSMALSTPAGTPTATARGGSSGTSAPTRSRTRF